MPNKSLSKSQIKDIAELLVLSIKASNTRNYNVSLSMIGSEDRIAFSIFGVTEKGHNLEYEESMKISEHITIFERVMKRWRNQLLDLLTVPKPTI